MRDYLFNRHALTPRNERKVSEADHKEVFPYVFLVADWLLRNVRQRFHLGRLLDIKL